MSTDELEVLKSFLEEASGSEQNVVVTSTQSSDVDLDAVTLQLAVRGR